MPYLLWPGRGSQQRSVCTDGIFNATLIYMHRVVGRFCNSESCAVLHTNTRRVECIDIDVTGTDINMDVDVNMDIDIGTDVDISIDMDIDVDIEMPPSQQRVEHRHQDQVQCFVSVTRWNGWRTRI